MKSNTHHIFPNLGQIPEEPVTWQNISLSANGLRWVRVRVSCWVRISFTVKVRGRLIDVSG